ncbi:MAG: DUF3306 domain-containing protein [Candidatus Thiodiazotropha sp.]
MSEDALPDETADREPFLNRWSRRKLEAENAPARAPEPAEPRAEAPPLLSDDDMPPLESLDEHSHYAGFLSPGVSEGLRQAALQKLFSSTCFNVCDGLDDYAEDFTRFEKLGDLMTADLRHRLQREAQRLAERTEPGEVSEAQSAPSQHDTAEVAQADPHAEPQSADSTHPIENSADEEHQNLS